MHVQTVVDALGKVAGVRNRRGRETRRREGQALPDKGGKSTIAPQREGGTGTGRRDGSKPSSCNLVASDTGLS